jgi:hypothetical protein
MSVVCMQFIYGIVLPRYIQFTYLFTTEFKWKQKGAIALKISFSFTILL